MHLSCPDTKGWWGYARPREWMKQGAGTMDSSFRDLKYFQCDYRKRFKKKTLNGGVVWRLTIPWIWSLKHILLTINLSLISPSSRLISEFKKKNQNFKWMSAFPFIALVWRFFTFYFFLTKNCSNNSTTYWWREERSSCKINLTDKRSWIHHVHVPVKKKMIKMSKIIKRDTQ